MEIKDAERAPVFKKSVLIHHNISTSDLDLLLYIDKGFGEKIE